MPTYVVSQAEWGKYLQFSANLNLIHLLTSAPTLSPAPSTL